MQGDLLPKLYEALKPEEKNGRLAPTTEHWNLNIEKLG
jgi:hypothetical protein